MRTINRFVLLLVLLAAILTGGAAFAQQGDTQSNAPAPRGNAAAGSPGNSQPVLRPPVSSPVEVSTPDLVIRSGDILFLGLPGEDTFNKTFQIDRRGNLQLPEVGVTPLAGKTLAQAQDIIRGKLQRVYRDIGRFEMVLKERRLLVTVLGIVKQPGPVELPGEATVQMAINAAGGLAQGAQLDRMQIHRGRETIGFDYKKYLDQGDPALLPALQPNDEIFIPASPLLGNVQVDLDNHALTTSGDGGDDKTSIKVFGEVNSPGSFSFKPEASVMEYLMRAGGVSRYASVEGIRILTKAQPHLFNLKEYMDTGNKGELPTIQPGTTIFVPKEIEEIHSSPHTVYVMGEVFKPGSYEAKPGTSFLDILANAGGPTRYADATAIRLLRVDGSVVQVNLLSYTESKTPGVTLPSISAGDTIYVPQHEENDKNAWLKNGPDKIVRIIGAVKNPGRFAWASNMTILDLIAEAGGPVDRANTAHIEVLPSETDSESKVEIFDLESLVEKGGRLDQLPVLRPGYTVSVPMLPANPNDSRASWLQQPAETSIYVLGALKTPGRYAFSKDMHFLDILSAADGPTATADLENVRVTHRHGGASAPHVSKLDLTAYFQSGDERLLPEVEPGDVIYIPDRSAEWLTQSKESTVRVLGGVARPGRYKFNDSMTILDLLAEAGGPNADAYQEKIVVVNFAQDHDQARTFNLVQFAKTGNFDELPVLRAGDTVYVPNASQSDYAIFISGVRDILSVLSIFALLGRV